MPASGDSRTCLRSPVSTGWGRWLFVGAATLAGAVAAAAGGLPSPALLAALTVGVCYALTLARRQPLEAPGWAMTFAQPVLGVTIGSTLQAPTMQAILADWAPIAITCVATIAASLLAGVGLSCITTLDRPTALLGMIAGGAEGIVAMASDLDTDVRLVAFMQYLRVLVIVVTAPALASLLVGSGPAAPRSPVEAASASVLTDLAFTGGLCACGAFIAYRLNLKAGALLIPLILAAALSVSGVVGGARVPAVLQQIAFAVIGLQVGLRCTVAAVRRAGRLLPAVLVAIAAILVTCAGLAALLSTLANVTFTDAYLATTPGGLSAVLAVALADGHNVTFVLAVQTLRLLAMLLVARLIVRRLRPA